MFNTKEQEIIKYGLETGKSRQEVESAIVKLRAGVSPQKEEVEEQGIISRTIRDIPSDIVETGRGISREFKGVTDQVADIYADPSATLADKVLATASGTFKFGSRVAGEAVVGGAKLFLTPEAEQDIKTKAEEIGTSISEKEQVQNVVSGVMQKWNALSDIDKQKWQNIGGFVEGGVDLVTMGMANKFLVKPVVNLFKKTSKVAEPAIDVVKKIPVLKTDIVKTPTIAEGVIQKSTELAERIPRAVEKAKQATQEAAERSARIKASSPAVQVAIKANTPEKMIDIVSSADNLTIKDMKKMVDIVDSKSDVRYATVAGDAAAKQYSLIDKQRKTIGAELGTAIKNLPDTRVDMSPSFNQLDEVLDANRIRVIDGKLNFDETRFTKAQGDAIQRLYEESRKGSVNNIMDATVIHNKDSLFGTLQRQDRKKEGLENIYIQVGEEQIPIYTAFRDIFRTQLDTLSPEVRRLNQQYAIHRSFVDDMDNTIFKQAKLNLALDPSDSAAINLRRIESNALSQPAFQKVIDEMSVIARELGYEGSDPASLIKFALELDALYPSKIPKASFAGGVRIGIGDVIEKVTQFGAPDVKDQQKALREMLDELLGETRN